jgi:hypothetical protein
VSCLSPDRIANDIVLKVEQLTRIASQAEHQPAGSTTNVPVDSLRRSAQTIISSAMTVVGESSTVGGGSERNYTTRSVNGEPLTQETRDRIQSWIAIQKIDEEGAGMVCLADNRHEAEPSRSSENLKPTTIPVQGIFQSFRIKEDPPEPSAPASAIRPEGAEGHLDDDVNGEYESDNETEYEITERLLQNFHGSAAKEVLRKPN